MNPDKVEILIVDDSSADLKILADVLTRGGYKIRSVHNGPLAIKAVTDETPDLILLDITLPEMDGLAVCRQLKKDEKSRK